MHPCLFIQVEIKNIVFIHSLQVNMCFISLADNSLAPGRFQFNFQANFSEWWLRYLLRNCPQMNATKPYWWSVNIGSGNGLVPSGNKPLPEPMLTQIYVVNLVVTWSNETWLICIQQSNQKDIWQVRLRHHTARHEGRYSVFIVSRFEKKGLCYWIFVLSKLVNIVCREISWSHFHVW